MNKIEDEIALLENALKGALLVPSECTFVSSEIIKTCLDTLKTYESWEYLITHEIEQKVRADERTKTIEECKKAIKQHWINGTVALRIAEEICRDLEQLKE